MIAAVCGWHERHTDVANWIEAEFDKGGDLSIAAHALIETYAVLTRLPGPHRLSPADAWTVIEANFVNAATLATLPAREHAALLRTLAEAGVGGGRSYDSLIARTASRANATTLLTLNPRHFSPPPAGMEVVTP